MNTKFKKVPIKRFEPQQYVRQLLEPLPYPRHGIRSNSDAQYDYSEVFSEKISNGFWVFLIESRENIDKCFCIQPKSGSNKYFAINFYISTATTGYAIDKSISWRKQAAIFSGPTSSYEIYVSKSDSIRHFRFVFSEKYLKNTLNLSNTFLMDCNVWTVLYKHKPIFIKDPTPQEKLALERLHSLFKYSQNECTYFFSLSSCVYNIADSFFRGPFRGQKSNHLLKDDVEAMAKVVLKFERNLLDKFPGIASLAYEFNMSPTKFKTCFKQIYHTTPLLYYRQLQVAYAISLLNNKQFTLKEISNKLGFKKSSTLSSWLKRYGDWN
ncbi:hypothetical protein DYBT9275_03234 [Dyadobacter sp. CECT 9275]|uniref:HTH araC/xylS-type domain-containing protein n=1 Tax=Dyadobacter helix TaxID=2822344 RepID=A0A916NCS9_9BACT|nr:AraC family transcriptional regulator [Dyadobacter sp. CECT 9275]CAG5003814.1 hypothetical protein DYBT9275_03234 [Dyadobacter sp. CECT 9275]